MAKQGTLYQKINGTLAIIPHQDILSCGELIGSMYRTDAAGTGGFSIRGTLVGQFPTITQAGRYAIITKMSSNTASYTCQFSLGSNTFTLTATDGTLDDYRIVSLTANSSWSGSVTQGSLAANSILDVQIYAITSERISVLSPVAISNNYNDLKNKPTIPTTTSQLTNDSGFLTSHQTVDTALSSTSTNPVQNKVINTALGTKANDSDVVKLTGDQTVDGIKEFSNLYHDSTRTGETDWETSSIIIRYQNYVKSSGNPSVNKFANILFLDKTGTNINWNGRLGALECDLLPSGTHRMRIICYKNEITNNEDSRTISAINVGFDSNGVTFATAPATSSNRTEATDIVTRGWLATDTRLVHTTGAEEISGIKTFISKIVLPSGTPGIVTETANSYLQLCGGKNNQNTQGSTLVLVGSGNATNPGSFALKAANSTNEAILRGQPNGTLTWEGSITLSGSSAEIKRSDDTSQLSLRGGSSTSGGSGLFLYAKQQSTYAGWFRLRAYDDTNAETDLIGKPDGSFTWGGKAFVYTSTNQTIAGAKTFSGNTVFNQSPKINLGNPYLYFVETDVTRGTVPSGVTGYQGIYFKDKNEDTLGSIVFNLQSSSSKPQGSIRFIHTGNTSSDTDHCILFRENTSSNWYFMPDGITDINLGGSGNYRWKEVWSVQGAINTSDERLKDNIATVPDAVLDAWSEISWSQYQMQDAIAKKGQDKARLHNGLIAQRIDETFKAHGLDAARYGLFCHDTWEAEEGQEAGDEYSLRYTEALAMEAAYQRRRADRAEARISALEEQIAEIKKLLGVN